MGKIIISEKRILDFAPNFRSGIASVLTPMKKNRKIRDVVMSIRQNDGPNEDWAEIGNDLRCAISKYNADMAWKRR